MTDLVNISIPTAAGYAVLGYLVVFLGLVMLMCVIFVMGRVMHKETPKAAPAAAAPAAPIRIFMPVLFIPTASQIIVLPFRPPRRGFFPASRPEIAFPHFMA